MKIQLKDWNVTNLAFSILDEKDKRDENIFDLASQSIFEEDDQAQSFKVGFTINVSDKSFDLNVDAIFNFETDSPPDEEFKLSPFPKINAPAIAFPFLRAFIANVTLQSGLEPVMLPTINFVELAKEKAKDLFDNVD